MHPSDQAPPPPRAARRGALRCRSHWSRRRAQRQIVRGRLPWRLPKLKLFRALTLVWVIRVARPVRAARARWAAEHRRPRAIARSWRSAEVAYSLDTRSLVTLPPPAFCIAGASCPGRLPRAAAVLHRDRRDFDGDTASSSRQTRGAPLAEPAPAGIAASLFAFVAYHRIRPRDAGYHPSGDRAAVGLRTHLRYDDV